VIVVALAVGVTATCEQSSRTGTDHALAPVTPVDRILKPLDSRNVVLLADSSHPRARPEWDEGPVEASFAMNRLALRFRPTSAQQEALDRFLAELKNPASPRFHQWIDRKEFGARYGLTDHDLDAAADWLVSEGFSIGRRTDDHLSIYFSGTAEQVERVFRTKIHRYRVEDEEFYANATDISIPAEVDGILYLVSGLDDVRPKPHVRVEKRVHAPSPDYTISGAHALVPADVAEIYGFSSLYSYDAGSGNTSPSINGAGMVVAVIGQTTYTASDITNFRTLSGLTTNAPVNYLYPSSGTAVASGNDIPEAILDLEWTGAVARDATINYVYAASGYTAFDAFEYACESPDLVGYPEVITISYGACEPANSASVANYLQLVVNSANTNGTTVVAATGDSGPAGCDTAFSSSAAWSKSGLAVQLPASIPAVTGAGGAEFNEGSGTYWWTGNDAGYESAKSYIPEESWNDTSSSHGLAAGTGGSSIRFSKPSWQTGTGVGDGGYRYVPDIAMSASPYHDAYMVCLTDSSQGIATCASGHGWDNSAGTTYETVGGTSAAAPVFAGFLALMNQAMGTLAYDAGYAKGLGDINTNLYDMAADKDASIAFNDITAGNNIVPCDAGLTGCVNGQFGFDAGVGYDEVTGLGSINAWNFWYFYPTATTAKLSVSPSAAAPGNTVTLSATVSTGDRIGPNITGGVEFFEGSTELVSHGITSNISTDGGIMTGTASYSLTTLDAGVDTLKVVYTGDTTYGTSTSGSVTITIASLAVSPSSLTTTANTSQTFTGSGGTQSSYAWSLSNNRSNATLTSCTTGSTTCSYKSGATTGVTDVLTMTDSLSNSTSVNIIVNAPLALSPSAETMAQGDTSTFTASGGTGSYTWSVSPSGAGVTVSSAGVVTATSTATSGSYTVTVTDTGSSSATATLTLDTKLSLSPTTTVTIAQGDTYSSFAASGGTGSNTWSVSPTGTGVTVSSTGVVAATSTATTGSYTVTVKDSFGDTASDTVTVNAKLSVSPTTLTITQGDSSSAITASGGVGTDTWSISPSGAGVTVSAGVVTATSTATTGSYTVTATDTLSNTASTAVTVNAKLAISPATTVTIAQGDSSTFTASGGTGSNTWSLSPSGAGVSVSSSGVVTATTTATTGSYTVTVKDSFGNTASDTVTVNAKLALSPSTSVTITRGDTYSSFVASGGVGTDTWSIAPSGAGVSISSAGVVTASSTATTGSYTVTVTDTLSNTATGTIVVNAALTLSPSTTVTIAQGDTYSSFVASGGTGSNTWSISPSSTGVSVSSAGVVTATSTATTESYAVTVKDSFGNSASDTVVVNAKLSVAPSTTVTIAQGDTYSSFTSSGGVGAITWSVSPSGAGVTVSSRAVTATTSATSGSYTITATDTLNNTATGTITVNAKLSVSPASTVTIAQGDTYSSFNTSGGVGTVTWSIAPAGAGVTVSGGAITASNSATTGSYTVTATDTLNNTAGGTVIVDTQLTLSPSTPITIAQGDTYSAFVASGGTGSNTWTVSPPGAGVTVSSAGVVTASSTATTGNYTVTVKDSFGNSASDTVVVNAALALTPTTVTIAQGDTYSLFIASGGVGTDSWSVSPAGEGVSISSTGVLTASSTASTGSYTVTLTDSFGDMGTSTVAVNAALTLAPSSPVTIAQGDTYSSFVTSGGTGSNTWSISPSGTGVSVSSSGVVTATASATTGSYSVTVKDSFGNTASDTVLVNVKLSVAPTTTVAIAQGNTYSAFVASGGVGADTWSISPSAAGVTVSGGIVTTSTTATTGTYTVTATDTLNNTATGTITVSAKLSVSPSTTVTIAQGDTYSSFLASGGVGSDTWSISPSGAGVTVSGGVVTASPTATTGTYTVTATDALNNTATGTITVNAKLTLSPSTTVTIAQGDNYSSFVAAGGVGSDTWSVSPAGTGVAVSSSGVVTASGTATTGSYTVTVTDGYNNTASDTVVVNAKLSVTPSSIAIAQGDTYPLAVSGGVGSDSWTVSPSGTGVTISSVGVVTASSSATTGSYTATVTDTLNNTSSATITVNSKLTLSPSTPVTIVAGSSYSSYVASGGVGADTWSIAPSGQGVTVSSGGVVSTTAGTVSGNYTVTVTDTLRNTATGTIAVEGALAVYPVTKTTDAGQSITLTAAGGSGAGYTWTFTSNRSGASLGSNCTVGSTTCTYQAGTNSGVADVVTVTDSQGISVESTITVDQALSIAPGLRTVDTGGSVTFTAMNGSGSGYNWSVVTNGSHGSLGTNCVSGSSLCTYTAGSTGSAQDTIALTDSNAVIVVATVTVEPVLQVSPSTTTTDANAGVTLSASGGSGTGYTWTLSKNNSLGSLGTGCTIGSATCTYTAGPVSGMADTITLSDSNGGSAQALVAVDAPLVLSPTTVTTDAGASVTLTASGGSGSGYAWAIGTNSSAGTLGANCMTSGSTACTWTAGATSGGADTITVTDSNGVKGTITVTIDPALVASPAARSVDASNSAQFSVSGGSGGNYAWSISSNRSGATLTGCTTGSTTCQYTAGALGNTTDVLTVVDGNNVGATMTITVNAALQVSPASTTTDAGGSVTLTASGGSGSGYAWSLASNRSHGTLGATCTPGSAWCTYTAGTTGGVTDTVQVTDSASGTTIASVVVDPALLVSPSTTTAATATAVLLTASGGSGSGYTWKIQANPSDGTLGVSCPTGSSTCIYTTGTSGHAADQITVTDGNNVTTVATITVVPVLALTPSSPLNVAPRQPVALSTNGTGDAPFTWSLTGTSNGSLSSSSGAAITYTAGPLPVTQDTVSVSDALHESASIVMTIGAGITVSPVVPTLATGMEQTFSATGGDSADGYTWTVTNPESGGSFAGNVYTAGPVAGTDTIQAEDAYGNTAQTTVTVVPVLAITPSSPVSVAPGQPVTFSVGATGEGPFSWTLTGASGGALSSDAGSSVTYTAGPSPHTQDSLTVTDELGELVRITIQVGAGIAISPATAVVVTSGTKTFVATGGYATGGYTFTVVTAGQRFGTFSGATYTAGSIPGTDTIQASDIYGNVATASITVVAPLAVTPVSPLNVAPQQQVTFQTDGSGDGPYTWSLASGGSGGSLSATAGAATTYTAGSATHTTDTVTVSDAIGETITITVNVGAGISISPLGPSVVVNHSVTFGATGGDSAGGYTWSVLGTHPNGSFSGSVYTAGAMTGTDTVQARDALGNTATTTVAILPALAVTPASPLTVSPMEVVPFMTSGTGIAPFTWSLASGGSGGSLSASSGSSVAYTAGGTGNTTDTLTISDAAGETVTVTISVQNGISISPVDPTILTGGQQSFTATGGDAAGGYTWSVVTAGTALGSFSGDIYTAGANAGVDTIQAKDDLGNTATMPVTIVAPLSVSPASPVTASLQQTIAFTADQGLAPFQWTLATNGSGAVFSASGASATYQAGTAAATRDVIRVTDALNEVVLITVNVGMAVTVSPVHPTVVAGQTQSFTATGGSGSGYVWSIPTNVSGATFSGSIYTAGTMPGTDVVQVKDSDGNVGTTSVLVVAGAVDAGQTGDAGTSPGTDAGGTADAGTVEADGGATETDGGPAVPDAGMVLVDAGTPQADAGVASGTPDAGSSAHVGGGCACRAGGSGDPLSLIGALGLLLLRRRRGPRSARACLR
jgi:hypothetical protein